MKENTSMFEAPEYKKIIEKARKYQVIGENALMLLGDSAEILKDTGFKPDSVITDPPYDFDSQGGKLFGREKSNFDKIRTADITDGFDFDILTMCAKADQMLIFMHNDQIFKIGDHLRHLYERFALLGWRKTNPLPVANKHYKPDLEIFFHYWRKPAFPSGKLSEKGRIVDAPVSKSIYDHPTVKPQQIMEKCVINASFPNDVILDPFCGSGSTGVAALKHGRKFIGIELDPDFYEMAIDRLSVASGEYIPEMDGQTSLFNKSKQGE